MFFSMPIFGQALLWTVITVVSVLAARFAIARKLPSPRALAVTALASLLVNSFYTWTFLPAHTGAMHGTWWYFAFLFIAVGLNQFLAYLSADSTSRSASPYGFRERTRHTEADPDLRLKPVMLVISAALMVLLIYPVGQVLLNQWPFGDASKWAEQANITVMPADAKLPQTDNKHIVMVDRDVALFLAQSKMGTDNLGSKYELNKEDFVKQSIASHLYWVCPLEYKSSWTQFWDTLSGSQSFPGFVIVDAENPDPNLVRLVHNLDLHYTNRAMFSHNIQRHLYALGYTDVDLDNPTIELDDNLEPYITVTTTRPRFVVGGTDIVQVLVVHMKDGSVTPYAPDKVPAFVDRVISEDMAQEYANNWGKFHFPGTGWTTSAFNGGSGQMKAYHTYMAYNTVDAPVFHIAMSANSDGAHSSTGVLVYDTRSRSGKFFPGLSGINLDNAGTFKNITENSNGNGVKEASEIGLYNVDGQTTFVAIFTAPQSVGRSFSGIGMMDAFNQSSPNVAYGDNKSASLRKYESYLALGNPNGTQVKDTQDLKKVTGTVEKANWVNGKLYLVLAEDPKHRFAATQDIAGGADLVEVIVGEKISLEYKDFGAREVEVVTAHYDPNQHAAK